MIKNKIIGIVAAITLLTAASAGTFITAQSNKTQTHVNRILLESHSINQNEAVVLNTSSSPLVLYSNPNASSRISGYISVGEMLAIKSHSNKFYKVTVQETGETGYISASDLELITSGVSDSYHSLNENGHIINVDSFVHLRADATINSKIISDVKNNTSLKILGKQGEWYKVNVDGSIGYIYQTYIGVSNKESNTDSKSSSKSNVKLLASATKSSNVKATTVQKSNKDHFVVIQEFVNQKNKVIEKKVIFDGTNFDQNNINSLPIPGYYTCFKITVFNNGKGISGARGYLVPQTINHVLNNCLLTPGTILIKCTLEP